MRQIIMNLTSVFELYIANSEVVVESNILVAVMVTRRDNVKRFVNIRSWHVSPTSTWHVLRGWASAREAPVSVLD